MLFNSYIFILIFLPIIWCSYFLLNHFKKYTFGKLVLLVGSLVFLGYSAIYYVVIFSLSVLINFVFIKWIKSSENIKKRKIALTVGIIFNILYLSVFKYTGFVIENVTLIVEREFNDLNIILPIGISFYTFQQIAYLVDTYRNEIPDYGLLDYSLFVAYFPKLIEGPLAYHNELIPQFNDERKKNIDWDNLTRGMLIFAVGLAKKVLVADNFGKIVDYGYASVNTLNSFEAILTIFAYTLQIYFDFSGYCDMAIGISSMFNISLPQNFDSPYKAKNIVDFWKRWHITLTRFLTKYIYIPLGGNRKGAVKTYVNILIVYLVSGLWHGAGYTFLIWGLMHGLASVLHRLWQKRYNRLPGVIQWGITFIFVSVTWIFFRATSVSNALSLLKQVVVGRWSFTINAELTETLLMPTLINIPSQILPFVLFITLATIGAVVVCVFCKNTNQVYREVKLTVKSLFITYFLLIASILSLSGVTGFLYTNF